MSATHEIVVADIGGTNARFALATTTAGAISLGEAVKLPTGDYSGLPAAFRAFAERIGRALPTHAAFAIAGPVRDGRVRMTNSPWVLQFDEIARDLSLDHALFLNDFEAIAHAAGAVQTTELKPLCGPDEPLPKDRPCTVLGPGTGLGVALLLPDSGRAIATEGGHIDFAPLDAFEDRLLQRLRRSHRRVSVERVVSGMGLRPFAETLAEIDGLDPPKGDDKTLWTRALAEDDPLLRGALDRFCRSLGSVAGDLALAHGPGSVVIAGGLGLRLAEFLPTSGFAERFCAKGRYEPLMATIPVRIITHPEPGLFGAAAAFAREHLS
ncbi:MAG: glucokinase [Citromicrobium sp.]|nr:glucokinase [Citromicrobium sp.]